MLQHTQGGRVPLFDNMVFNGDIGEGTGSTPSSKRLPGPEQRRGEAVCSGHTCYTSHKHYAISSPTHCVMPINSMKCMQRGPLRRGLGGGRRESSQPDFRRTSSGQRLAHGHTPCRVPTAQHLLFVPSFRVPPPVHVPTRIALRPSRHRQPHTPPAHASNAAYVHKRYGRGFRFQVYFRLLQVHYSGFALMVGR